MQHDLAMQAAAWEQRGIRARDAGFHEEAISCFTKAVTLADRALSWLGLALSQIDLKRQDDAITSLHRALALSPQSKVIGHLLAALTGGAPARAPDAFVTWLFNSRAASFDTHLARLGYRGPEMLHDLAVRQWEPEGRFSILDIGCGTGLSGVPFRPYASRLDGIDLAPGMLDQAARRGIYDTLMPGEIHAVMGEMPSGSYDLLLAADTLIYIGDIGELFRLAWRVLKPGGSFLFTVETGAEGSGFRLTPTGRYSHAEGYLRSCAEGLFGIEDSVDGMIRVEDGQFATGRAYRLAQGV